VLEKQEANQMTTQEMAVSKRVVLVVGKQEHQLRPSPPTAGSLSSAIGPSSSASSLSLLESKFSSTSSSSSSLPPPHHPLLTQMYPENAFVKEGPMVMMMVKSLKRT
nr:hypothetical protein [Tanacetum cinerariifolium]